MTDTALDAVESAAEGARVECVVLLRVDGARETGFSSQGFGKGKDAMLKALQFAYGALVITASRVGFMVESPGSGRLRPRGGLVKVTRARR